MSHQPSGINASELESQIDIDLVNQLSVIIKGDIELHKMILFLIVIKIGGDSFEHISLAPLEDSPCID